jgi:hypothetical protein
VEPTHNYPGIASPYGNRAMRILEIAFSAFFDDTKQLVATGVRDSTANQISEAQSIEEKNKANTRALERERHLKAWLKSERPLAYGHNNDKMTFEHLVQAVVTESEDICHGLPNMMNHSMTPTDFASDLIQMSKPYFPTPPHAPVLSNGSFLPVLKLSHKKLVILSRHDKAPSEDAYLLKMFLFAIHHFDISFIPSHIRRTATRGAPNKKAVYNSWAYLGLRDAHSSQPLPSTSNAPSSSQRAASIALNNALAKDCNASWTIYPLHLSTIVSILHKASLPSDWSIPPPVDEAYVNETYTWVKQAYDSRKPLHHLALIVSLIITCIRPQLFLPSGSNFRQLFKKADTKKAVKAQYDSLPWDVRKQKGLKDELRMVTMFTTFIIALYEPTSPLRIHMNLSHKQGLGDAWTSKHSKSLIHSNYIYTHIFVFKAIKSISYPTLIRIGILWGVGVGAYEHGTFGQAWGCHSPQYIENMYKTLTATLKGAKDDAKRIYAPFDALSLLIGDKNARVLCKSRAGVSSRPPPDGEPSVDKEHAINDVIDVDMLVDRL